MKAFLVTLTALLTLSLFAATADARGRTGSHRSGGFSSHGKGSHYYGGH